MTFLGVGIVYIGAQIQSITEDLPLKRGGKDTTIVSMSNACIFLAVCLLMLFYQGNGWWNGLNNSRELDGILRQQALDNLRPRKRATCVSGLGCCIGIILCLIPYLPIS